MKKLFILLFTCSVIFSQTYSNLNNLKSNLEFLASDLLEGREAGADGGRLAALYLSKEFQKMEIEKFSDTTEYFQYFDVNTWRVNPNSKMKMFFDGEEKELSFPNNFVVNPLFKNTDGFNLEKCPIVFAKYGISADEYKYNDYEGLDCENKVVVVSMGEPFSEDSTFFNGAKPSKYSDLFYKIKNSFSKKAAAIFLLPDDMIMGLYKMLAIDNRKTNMGLKIKTEFDKPYDDLNVPAFIWDKETADYFLEKIELTENKIAEWHKGESMLESFETDLKISIDLNFLLGSDYCNNVIAMVSGKNDNLKNELIVVGAHFDHIGMGGDKVNNGADDNASGTVVALEVARILNKLKFNERSVAFVLYDAEEKGLLGSSHFVNSFKDSVDIIMNINLDMLGRENENSVYIIGPHYCSEDLVEIIAELDDKNDELEFNYSNDRIDGMKMSDSDHSSFIRNNIPAVFFTDEMESDLHRPTDDSEKINYVKLQKISDQIVELLKVVTQSDCEILFDRKNK